jgi:hypothetical protein
MITASMQASTTGFTGWLGSTITGTIGGTITASVASATSPTKSTMTVTQVSTGVTLAVGTVINISGTNVTISALGTGSGGTGTYTLSKTYSKSISSTQYSVVGTTLTVTAGSGITSGVTLTGSGITSGTTISFCTTDVSSGTGGVGTYTVSSAQLVTSENMTIPSYTLNVTSGAGIGAGQVITGTGIASGTTISAQVSGTTGGAGTYTVTASAPLLPVRRSMSLPSR